MSSSNGTGCLQRWALTLSNYSYSIKFKKGSLRINADALDPMVPEEIALLEPMSTKPLTAAKLQSFTFNPVFAEVRHFVLVGAGYFN